MFINVTRIISGGALGFWIGAEWFSLFSGTSPHHEGRCLEKTGFWIQGRTNLYLLAADWPSPIIIWMLELAHDRCSPNIVRMLCERDLPTKRILTEQNRSPLSSYLVPISHHYIYWVLSCMFFSIVDVWRSDSSLLQFKITAIREPISNFKAKKIQNVSQARIVLQLNEIWTIVKNIWANSKAIKIIDHRSIRLCGNS